MRTALLEPFKLESSIFSTKDVYQHFLFSNAECIFVWNERLSKTSKNEGLLKHLEKDDDLVQKAVRPSTSTTSASEVLVFPSL